MKVQSFGKYDCQSRKDFSFRAVQNRTVALRSVLSNGLGSKPQGNMTAKLKHFGSYISIPVRNLITLAINFKDRAANKAIGLLVRTLCRYR